MLDVNDFKKADVLVQNCRVGKVYPSNCVAGVLCSPTAEFDMIEKCTNCSKKI